MGGSSKRTKEKMWSLAARRLPLRTKLDGDCLVYTGWKDANGYGKIVIAGKTHGAHRVSYIISKGKIPRGLSVLHSCDNPSCINPEHLRVGTKKDNSDDMWSRRRNTSTHIFKRKNSSKCSKGHELSGENLYMLSGNRRNCRACRIDASKRYRDRNRVCIRIQS